MPVYEYRCKDCNHTHEIQHGFNDERPTKCPACGGVLVRIFHPVGLVFKGSGFHKTDYSGEKKAAPDSKSTDTKPAEAKPAETKPDAKPSEPKPSTDSAKSS